MPLDASDLGAIWLTVKLASLTTVILLIIGTPVAWWLARTRLATRARGGGGCRWCCHRPSSASIC